MNFDIAINRVLGHEGGYTTGKNDPGGETNWGISKRSYPTTNIKALTRDQAIAIYRRDFWKRVHADELPEDVQFQVLDFAINSGIETAVRKLQSAAGVADDGYWGPVTRAAVSSMPPAVLLFRFMAKRLDFMRRLSAWRHFGAGWAARIAENMMHASDDLLEPDASP